MPLLKWHFFVFTQLVHNFNIFYCIDDYEYIYCRKIIGDIMQYDVIIIGGGLGGLTAGAVLSKKGKKVLLLEQHFMVGGAATIFKRKDINLEVGLHEMDFGEFGYDIKRNLFQFLEIDKRVEFISLPETWQVVDNNVDYKVPEGIKEAKEYLISQFPHEEKGIKKYFKMMKLAAFTMGKLPYDMNFFEFLIYPLVKFPFVVKYFFDQRSTGEVLDSLFKDDKLKRLLNANLVYFHDNPYEFSWHYHALAQYNYYNGAKFIKGGSYSLSKALSDIIVEFGGTVELMCNVDKVLVDNNGKAYGVSYTNKRTKEVIEVTSDYVIANCAPENLYTSMVDEKYNDTSLEKFEESVSLYTVYLIFKENLENIYKNHAYSTFICQGDYEKPFSQMNGSMKDTPIEDRGFVFVDYGRIDSGLAIKEDEKRAVGVFCSASYLSEWENLPKEEYMAKKNKLVEDLFIRAEKYFPNLKDHVEYFEVSTPKTIKRYMKTPSGTAYGYKNNNYLRKGRVPRFSKTIKNLLFTGAYAFPGGGFTGALISGYMAAMNLIEPLRIYIIRRLIITTIICIGISTAYKWIPALLNIFK